MINKAVLVGNAGHDPELKHTSAGKPWTKLNIATTESWKDEKGERQSRTEWHNCIFFGKLAEVVAKYAKKGGQYYIEGRIETTKTEDGKYFTSIKAQTFKMLGRREGAGEQTTASVAENLAEGPPASDGFDDLPF